MTPRIPLPKQTGKPFKVKKQYSRKRDKKMIEKHIKYGDENEQEKCNH